MYTAFKNNDEWVCCEFDDYEEMLDYIIHWTSGGFPVACFKNLDDMEEWGIDLLKVVF